MFFARELISVSLEFGFDIVPKETLIKCHYRPFFGFFSLWECLGGD
jgi:hypothetical protein